MKRFAAAAVMLGAAVAFCGSARAEDGEKGRGDRKAEFLKKFDKDGNGELSDKEKAAAREEFQKRRGDAQGGKRGDDARRGPGRPGFNREEMLKKFDKDESGDLNEAERAELRKHMEELRAKHGGEGRPGHGHRPGFDREKLIKEFDKDSDGKLNEEERAAAHAAIKKRFQERGGKPGEGRGKPGEGRGKPGEGRGKPKGEKEGD